MDRQLMHQLHTWMAMTSKAYGDKCVLQSCTLTDILNSFILPTQTDIFALQWLYRGDFNHALEAQSAIMLAPVHVNPLDKSPRKAGDYRALVAQIDTEHLKQVLAVTVGLKQKIGRRGMDEANQKSLRQLIDSIRGVFLSDAIPEEHSQVII
jgi:hypothetical protein